MPLINQSEVIENLEPTASSFPVAPESKDTDSPSFFESFGASMRLHNTIGSAVAFGSPDVDEEFDQGYNPFEGLEGTIYGEYPDSFIHVNNEKQKQQMMSRIDQQIPYREINENSGWTGLATDMAVQLFDPINFIPGAGAAKGIKAITVGAKALKGAKVGAGTAVTATAVQESILGAQQETRTREEQAYAILASGVFGGLLGGAIGGASKGTIAGGEKMVKDILQGVEHDLEIKADGKVGIVDHKSVGAAESGFDVKVNRDAEGIAHMNKWVSKVFHVIPAIRNLDSAYGTVRTTVSDIWQHGIILNKNKKRIGTQTSLEGFQRQDAQHTIKINDEVRKVYLTEVAGRKSGEFLASEKAFLGAKKGEFMSVNDFSKEVDVALRNNTTHADPAVQKVATLLRKEMDTAVKKMQRLGILDKEISAARQASYLSRVYNVDYIVANEAKILRRFAKALLKDGTDRNTVFKDAQDIIDNMKGIGDNNIQMSSIDANSLRTKSGSFTKARSDILTDDLVSDLLVHDGVGIFNRYMATSNNLIRAAQIFERNGVDSLASWKGKLKQEHEDLIAAGEKLTPADLKKASKAIDDMFAIGLGQMSKESRYDPLLKSLRFFNTTTMLGGVTISSIPDLAMPIFRHTLGRTIQHSWVPYFKNIGAAKMSADDLADFGVANKSENESVLNAMQSNDGMQGIGKHGKLDKVLGTLTGYFGNLSVLSYWNNGGRRNTSRITAARMIRALKEGDNMSQSNVEWLSSIGIGKAEGDRILKQFDQWGAEVDGSYIMNHSKWTQHERVDADGNGLDESIDDLLGNAVLTDVNATIIVPSQGEIPITFQKNEMGRSVFQYKSFIMGASNKILFSSLQRRDRGVVQGLTALVGMGALSYVIKQKIAGREPNLEVGNLIKEGVARSGVAGLMGEISFLMVPGMTDSRYARNNTASTFMGPTFSRGGDVNELLQGTADGIDEADAKKLKKFVPLQNLFYLQWAFNQLEDEE